MDHKVSKDMISSGMIPSGEKTQADLGRIQYGSNPSPSSLADAYKSIYEHHQKDKDGNTIPHEGEELNEALPLVPMLGKVAAIAAKKGVAGMAAKGAGKAGLKATAMAFKNPTAGNIGKVAGQALKGAAKDPYIQQNVVSGAVNKMNEPKEKVNKSGMVTAGADLFDIVKGQLLDEGLTEEEIKDIMLTLTPDEILKEIEESSLSAGSGTGTGDDMRSDGGDGVFRTKTQVANMFNKNIPAKRNGKVDKFTRKAINTSARDMGIQGPTTLKQSVEPEGETI